MHVLPGCLAQSPQARKLTKNKQKAAAAKQSKRCKVKDTETCSCGYTTQKKNSASNG